VLDLAAPAVDAPAASAKGSGRERRRHRWSRHGKGAKPATDAPGADPT
jgi:hypothetical protein